MKRIARIEEAGEPHWVGNGFPVRSYFSYDEWDSRLSPFLLLDYAAEVEFAPTRERRGVGKHPHRGFETVTIVYQGGVEHRDSAGNHGRIGPGDVQWMTAASGVIHEEWIEGAYLERGGKLEMAQLWVNLPAKDKMAKPNYQEIADARIPKIDLGGGASARVIAGELRGKKGPARTFTPIDVWDVRIPAGARVELEARDGWDLILPVLRGKVVLNGKESAGAGQFALFERSGDRVAIEAQESAALLWLGGEPIEEPVVGYGPFVMNTEAEIRQAIADFRG